MTQYVQKNAHVAVQDGPYMWADLLMDYTPIPYSVAVTFMAYRVQEILCNNARSMIWLLEHQHTYTVGQNTDTVVVQNMCNLQKIPVHFSERGGKVMYHGPGQRIAYFMLDLAKLYEDRVDVRRFIYDIENVVILTMAKMGIYSFRKEGLPGVWVFDTYESDTPTTQSHDLGQQELFCIECNIKKIAALGLKFKKGVSSHGAAINICPDLGYYSHIEPCGLHSSSVSSLKSLNKNVTMKEFDIAFLHSVKNVFPNLMLSLPQQTSI